MAPPPYPSASSPRPSSMASSTSKPFPFFTVPFSSSTSSRRRRLINATAVSTSPHPPNLRRLTSRIVQLTRRRQLRQIFEEIEAAKSQHGKNLNTIVMNAVLQACVHCRDIDSAVKVFDDMSKPDSCGVDTVTYGTLLKGLGDARRVDEAFRILELVEKGKAVGRPQLSARLVSGLLNALIEAGDLLRADGLLARFRFVLREGGNPSISMYNLLMKGHISSGSPQSALALYDEVLCLGLTPDTVTYNTLILACVKAGKMDAAMRFLEEMKVTSMHLEGKSTKKDKKVLCPDIVTYTTLLKGFGNAKDLLSVEAIVLEMKLRPDLVIDRTAFTAIIDALLNCGSIKAALCMFGEILKRARRSPGLRPKPHLFLSMMRTFATEGDYTMVRNLHRRMLPDSAGTISRPNQEEADHLLMEAALNNGQVEVATKVLAGIAKKWGGLSWTSRGGLVALKIEVLLGFDKSFFRPYVLQKVSPREPIERIMTPLDAAQPLPSSMYLKDAVMRFFKDQVVPIVDEWGCVGLVHRDDCVELDAQLATVMRTPPCVTISDSIEHVIDLILEKKYQMVVVVKSSSHGTSLESNSKPVGVFSAEQLSKLIEPVPSCREKNYNLPEEGNKHFKC